VDADRGGHGRRPRVLSWLASSTWWRVARFAAYEQRIARCGRRLEPRRPRRGGEVFLSDRLTNTVALTRRRADRRRAVPTHVRAGARAGRRSSASDGPVQPVDEDENSSAAANTLFELIWREALDGWLEADAR